MNSWAHKSTKGLYPVSLSMSRARVRLDNCSVRTRELDTTASLNKRPIYGWCLPAARRAVRCRGWTVAMLVSRQPAQPLSQNKLYSDIVQYRDTRDILPVYLFVFSLYSKGQSYRKYLSYFHQPLISECGQPIRLLNVSVQCL